MIGSLDLPEQGIYYAIIGITGIQAYFELGLLNVLVSQSSHTAAAMDLALKNSSQAGSRPITESMAVAASRMRDLQNGPTAGSVPQRHALIAIGLAGLLFRILKRVGRNHCLLHPAAAIGPLP